MKTLAWQQYEQGVDYKTRIGLYSTVDLNERFFAGDQWAGIPHEGLPTPVVNFIRYASAWKIAAVTDRRLKMSFFAEGVNDGEDIGIYAKQISAYCDMLWERLKMDYLTKEGLKQAAITGDYVQYFYWDPDIKTGQALTGDINTLLIDNVNYYPGNPNNPDVQSQPYIIIAFRELLSKVKEEAKRNGCENIDEVVSDEDNEYMSGDRGKIELEDSGKCNVLLKMYKKDGHVWCEKSVRSAVIQPEKDSGLTRYPVAVMNWDTRKNCCHGTAEVTGLIPNQVFINKILALAQLGQVQTSFPKVIYDKTRIREWTNKVAGAIAVNGDIGGAAQYLSPPVSSYDAWRGLDVTLQTTMKMMGANDVTLGNIRNPDNTSAFIATRDAAMVPLQSQQERFYSFIEDVGLVWLDFIKSFYRAGRMIPVVDNGQKVFVPIPEGELDRFTMNLRVDVGPSSMWSEIQVLQTLDNLLRGGKISFKQYLERMPDGHIPMKDELLQDVLRMEEGQAAPGQPQGQGAGQIVQAVQALAKAGKIPPQIAQAVMQLAQKGADAGAIMQALKSAAEQGQIPEEAVQAIAGALQGQPIQSGGSVPPPASADNSAPADPTREGDPRQQGQPKGQAAETNDAAAAKIVKLVQALAQVNKLPAETAQAVLNMARQGASAQQLIQALESAANQGKIPPEAMQTIAGAMQGQPVQSGVSVPHPAVTDNSVPAASSGGEDLGQPERQTVETSDTAAAKIVRLIQELAQEGKIPTETAQKVLQIAQQGAGAQQLMQVLKIAADQGKIPPEAKQAIAGALQGHPVQPGEGTPIPAGADNSTIASSSDEGLRQQGQQVNNITAAVQALVKAGKIDAETAKRILDIAGWAGSPEAIVKALKEAVKEGSIHIEDVQAVAALLQSERTLARRQKEG